MDEMLSSSSSPQPSSFNNPENNATTTTTTTIDTTDSTTTAVPEVKSLPRSIRWRLQLGVWSYPLMDEIHNDDSQTPYSSSVLSQSTLIQNIWEHNRDLVEIQRSNYNLLVEMLQEVMDQDKHSDDDNPTNTIKEKTSPTHECIVNTDSTQTTMPLDDIDPLTAMVKERDAQERRLHELDIQYRKRRARRRLGVIPDDKDGGDIYSASSTLGLIEKDLIRLPQEHYTYHHSRKNFAHHGENVPFELSATERSTRLTELLQIYAHQNPHIGYRQGMHELSSYLLLVLEIDLYDQESQSSGGESKNPLLDPQYIAHDTYGMFLALMSQLAPAYDIKMNQGAESPMELMAQSILAKIQYTANDKTLYQHLIHLHCPPELYCTRWVRLLFSREVSGWKNVLLLWDIFFDLTSKCPHLTSMTKSRYTRPGVTPPLELGKFPLMLVLEATSASMILLQRKSLLSHPEGSESDSIQRLMNIPPLQNILPLTATLLSMMRRVQQQGQQSQPIKKESMTMEYQLGTTKRSVSLSELAQNALATGSQSIFNMLSGGGGGNNNNSSHNNNIPYNNQSGNVSEGQQQASFPKRRSSHQKIQSQESSPNTNNNYKEEDKAQSYRTTMPDRRRQIENLAVQINNSVVTIRNYLMDLEHGVSGMNTTPIRVPQSIWLAMEDMDRVQKELIQTIDTSPSST